jgi:predicted nucleic acid-binding protein
MNYLADADFIIDHFNNLATARSLLPRLLREGTGVSIVTQIELYEGVFRSRNPRQAERDLRAFLRGVTLLPLTRVVALRTARVRAELRGRGRPVQHRAFDLIVAATALEYGLTLVTSNSRDYSDIRRLRVLNSRVR